MEDKFMWKAEMKFEGTAKEFNQLAEALEKLPIEIYIPEWQRRPHHFAGCLPIPIDVFLGAEKQERLIEGMPRMKIKYIKDIAGGIRAAHLHLADEVVLLDRARFKTFVAQISREMGGRRAESIEDYVDVMDPIGRLAATPIEIP